MYRRLDHKGDGDFTGARNVLTKTRGALGRMDRPRGRTCPGLKEMFPDSSPPAWEATLNV